MGTKLGTEAMLALLDVGDAGLGGSELQDRLAAVGRRPGADALLIALLRLETSGHVAVSRGASMMFALTAKGRERAYELGGGQPVHLQLLMADLVGYVAFTSAHGDAAGRAAAGSLHQAASDAVRLGGGEVVKVMGDGFLAWLPPSTDPVPVVTSVAAGCSQPSGEPWRLRAASHVGHPIRHRNDLFGNDVNLVARLCAAAAPGELVRSTGGHGTPEQLVVRGIDAPVAVWRVAVP
ncbi:MAG: adenylate/guanylate cyclase domain-containing protein [Acidimicrobiales bacterium]